MHTYPIPPNPRPAKPHLPTFRRRAWWSRITALTVVLSLSAWLTASAAGPVAPVKNLNAGPAALVKDINEAPFQENLFTQQPYNLTEANGTLFFTAWDEINGTELWKSDGTPSGTMLVKDIFPGPRDSFSWPGYLTNVRGTLYFSADDGSAGQELWKSDGTSGGTVLVKDIVPGPLGSRPNELTNVNGTLFFSATGDNGRQIWKSDGTTAGTVLVKEGFSDSASYGGFNQADFRLINVNGTLFFTNGRSKGVELWWSDGTEAGTILLMTAPRQYRSPTMTGFTAVNNILFFCVYVESIPAEIWKSDGTVAGTALIKEIDADNLTAAGGKLFFTKYQGQELWRSDGTTAGTQLMKNFGAGVSLGALINFNGTLFFDASGPNGRELWKSNGTSAGTVFIKTISSSYTIRTDGVVVNGTLFFGLDGAAELWKSDGTAAGTVLVKDFSPGPGWMVLESLTSVNGSVFCIAGDFDTGFTLWKSDGTTSGTVPIKPPSLIEGSSHPSQFITINGTRFFTADDGINGEELWKSDGTAEGTILVKDILAGPNSSWPRELIDLNGTLLFTPLSSGYAMKLWTSDGTPQGTMPVKDISLCDIPYDGSFVTSGGVLFFCANDGQTGNELWKSDGTEAGTVLVKDIDPSSFGMGGPFGMIDMDGTLFFGAKDGTGLALWKTDGTPDGTLRILALSDLGLPGVPLPALNVNGTLFFRQVVADRACELWRSDGTAEGTVPIKRFGNVSCYRVGCDSPSLELLATINGRLFFAARETGKTNALWTSDGTPQGTVQLTDAGPGWFADLNGMLIFSGYNSQSGAELWKSDGTVAGTTMLKDILPGSAGSMPANLTIVDGTLFFTANDGATGIELWKSDGTETGTVQIKDSVPGFGGAVPSYLVNANGTLVFSAWDPSHGVEPWMSDGTAAGTIRIQDIAPGNTNSNPSLFHVSDNQLFFSANDGMSGQELWVLPMAAIHPVSAMITPEGGHFDSLLDSTSYTFPAGAFSAPATVTHRVRDPESLPAVGSLVSINHAFEVTAVTSATGELVQPAQPYTLTVRYGEAELGPAIEATLALYSWDGGQWLREPSSVVDPATKVITATPNHFSLWEVLGETHRMLLPAVLR